VLPILLAVLQLSSFLEAVGYMPGRYEGWNMLERSKLFGCLFGALALVGLLSSCSFEASVGGKSFDQAEVEQLISDGLEAEVGVAPDAVDCEGVEDLDVEEGNTFTCVGTAGDDTFDINMTLTDDDGKFDYEVPG